MLIKHNSNSRMVKSGLKSYKIAFFCLLNQGNFKLFSGTLL
jgi:hypothetical protein